MNRTEINFVTDLLNKIIDHIFIQQVIDKKNDRLDNAAILEAALDYLQESITELESLS